MTNVKTSLTIVQIRDRVSQAENRIRMAVQQELVQLYEAGISPEYVSVDLNEVTAFGDELRRHVVSRVRLDVPLK